MRADTPWPGSAASPSSASSPPGSRRRSTTAASAACWRRARPSSSVRRSRDTGPLAFPGKVLGARRRRARRRRLGAPPGAGARRHAGGSCGRSARASRASPTERADTASFRSPQGLAERAGALYVADTGNHAVRRMDLGTGRVETVAGTGRKAEGALQPAADARSAALRSPWDVVFVGDTLWIAMAGAHQLWRLDVADRRALARRGERPRGPRRRYARRRPPSPSPPASPPTAACSTSPTARPARSAAWTRRAGTVKTLAGQGLFEFGLRDGPLGRARFQHPLGLALVGQVLWVSDTFNGAVRRVSLADGQVTHRRAWARPARRTHRSPEGGSWWPTPTTTGSSRVDPGTGGAHPARARRASCRRSVRGLVERPVLATRALPLQHVEDATVASAGASLVLEVRLPEGHTFTAGAPQRVELSVGGRSTPVQLEAAGDVLRASAPVSPLRNALRRRVLGGALLLPGWARLGLPGGPAAPAQSPGPGRTGGRAGATVHYRPTPPRPGS